LPLFIKGPLKEGWGLLLVALVFWLGLWLDYFVLGFFGVGSFRKRKELMKGKNC
jgi:O-antigen/teichoic acid export membrane protein